MPWLEFVLLEAAFLVVLTALGCGVMAVLGGPTRVAVRLALIPSAGLALASVVMTTAHAVLSASTSLWVVLLPALAVSAIVAVRAVRRAPQEARRLRWPPVLAVAALVVATSAVLASPLVRADSLGPMGYTVFDANSYVGFAAGVEHDSLSSVAPTASLQESPDLTFRNWAFYARSFVLARTDNIVGAVATGLHAPTSDLQAPFMAALLVIGALGMFALVLHLTRRGAGIAAAAGALYAGPLFLQLYVDGSQGLIAGLGLLPGAILALTLVIDGRGVRAVLLTGLFAAGLQTTHPVFLVLVGLWGGLIAATTASWLLVRRRAAPAVVLRRVGAPLVAVGALTAVLSPVALVFNFKFYAWAKDNLIAQGLPEYHLPVQVLPGWLLQTREFYFLPRHPSGLQDILLSFVVPAVLAAVIVLGAFRHRAGWLLLLMAVPVLAFGVLADVQQDCSYCVQRNLIPLAPLALALLGVGLTVLWARRGVLAFMAVGIAAATLGLAMHKSNVVARRLDAAGYAVPQSARQAADAIPRNSGPVYLEALGQGINGPAAMEMTALYNLFNEHTDARLALSIETNDYAGLTYLIGLRPPATAYGPEFTPGYRWILTRVADIRTNRRTVRRAGPFAFQERRGPFDISVTSGVAVDREERDHRGQAWVQGPMSFWITAQHRAPAFARLTFATPPGLRVRPTIPSGARIIEREKRSIVVCAPVGGTEPGLRRLTVALEFAQGPPTPPANRFGPASPPKTVRLAAMEATATPACRRGTG